MNRRRHVLTCLATCLTILGACGHKPPTSALQETATERPSIEEILQRLLAFTPKEVPADYFPDGHVGIENGAQEPAETTIDFATPAPLDWDFADLREFDSPAKNQRPRATCTAFGTVSALENLIAQESGSIVDLSEEHLWSFYRQPSTPAAVRAAERNFIATEPLWPYNDDDPAVGADELRKGSIARLAGYQRPSISIDALLESLQDGKTSIVYFPSAGWSESSGNEGVLKHGNWGGSWWHVMAITGIIRHSDLPRGGAFIAKDSFGPDRGDGGYWYVPFSHCFRNGRNRCGTYVFDGVERRDPT